MNRTKDKEEVAHELEQALGRVTLLEKVVESIKKEEEPPIELELTVERRCVHFRHTNRKLILQLAEEELFRRKDNANRKLRELNKIMENEMWVQN